MESKCSLVAYLTNLLSVVNMVTKAIYEGSNIDHYFLDFSKAFDIVTGMNNILAARPFQVCIGNAQSYEASVPCGVPQGSIISPLYFLVMINDLPDEL